MRLIENITSGAPLFSWDTAGVVTCLGAGALFSLLLTPLVRRFAVHVRAMDMPDPRKVHKEPVPRLGGAAVVLAATLVSLLALVVRGGIPDSWHGLVPWVTLIAGVLVIAVTGALDDIRSLPARTKFAIEIAAASLVVVGAALPVSVDLSPFFGKVELGWVGAVIGVFWIVGLTNAVNMLDVVDGAAVGVSAIASLAAGLIAGSLGFDGGSIVLLSLAGALLGFLPHNFRKRMFLGDAGSLTVGFTLGAATLIWFREDGAWMLLPAVLVLGLPLAECGLTFMRRSLKALAVVRADGPRERFELKRGPAGLFIPDRRHVPHRLMDLGFSLWQTVALLYGIGAVLGLMALGTVELPWVGPLAGVLLIAAVAYLAPRWLYDELRVLERGALLPMLESKLIRSRVVQVTFDLVAVTACFVVARYATRGAGSAFVGTAELTATVGATVAGFWLSGLYRASYRHASLHDVLGIAWSVGFGVLGAVGVSGIAFGAPFEAGRWLLAYYLVLTLVLVARFSFRILEHLYQRAPRQGRRVLIFGAGRAGAIALREMLSNSRLDLVPVGFLDDDPQMRLRSFHGYPVYGEDQQLEFLMRSLRVEQLVVSTEKADTPRLAAVAAACRICGVRLVRFEVRWDAAGHAPREAADGVAEPQPHAMEK